MQCTVKDLYGRKTTNHKSSDHIYKDSTKNSYEEKNDKKLLY